MQTLRRNIFTIIIAVCAITAYAGKIEKAFQALDIYNYFEAKKLFEKSLKRDRVAASYGLSLIYHRNDNPFYNLDSARRYIVIASDEYSELPQKKKEKYLKIQIDSSHIFSQRKTVSDKLYQRAKLNHTIKDYQLFIDNNYWSEYVDSAIYHRDELAFSLAEEQNNSTSFTEFLTKYPTSHLKEEAVSNYERLNYQEQTASNNFVDYVAFVENFPNSPYRHDAEDQVFEISTKTATLESYQNFIKSYPKNRNVSVAWKKLYNTYLQDNYSSDGIQAFMEEFKDYPYQKELLKQMVLVQKLLLPIKSRNKWGYIDREQETYIKPQFDLADAFHEGLAIISYEGAYGFVDKTGEIVIPTIFDDAFKVQEGHAVVGLQDKWGLINRSGEFVIEPIYEDLGNLNEGLTYFSENENYGYFDKKGVVRLQPIYTDASDFELGKAIVSTNSGYGLIDPFGTTFIPFKYDRLLKYDENRYAAKLDDKWGIIDGEGEILLPFDYSYIGKVESNRALVEKDSLFNYLNNHGELILDEWISIFPEHRQLAMYTNGFARVLFSDGYNLLDTNGHKLFKSNKEDLGFYGDLIAVKKGEKWGYFNRNGGQVIGYNYTGANSFEGALAKAGGAPLVGIINKKGEYLIEPYFERLEFYNDTLLIAKSRGDFGVLQTNGDTLLNFSYERIEPFSEELVQLITREAVYYYDFKSNQFIRKEDN